MSYEIFKTTPEAMHIIGGASNVNIKPEGLDFVNLNAGDLIEPGDTFQITLSNTDPLLEYSTQLYTIKDQFQTEAAFTSCNYILPFFVSGSKKELNQTVYDCVKVYKGFLNVPGVFQGEML